MKNLEVYLFLGFLLVGILFGKNLRTSSTEKRVEVPKLEALTPEVYWRSFTPYNKKKRRS